MVAYTKVCMPEKNKNDWKNFSLLVLVQNEQKTKATFNDLLSDKCGSNEVVDLSTLWSGYDRTRQSPKGVARNIYRQVIQIKPLLKEIFFNLFSSMRDRLSACFMKMSFAKTYVKNKRALFFSFSLSEKHCTKPKVMVIVILADFKSLFKRLFLGCLLNLVVC